MTVYDGRLYFGAAGLSDSEWRVDVDHRDDCDGARQSSLDPRVHFVVSASNIWDPEYTYDCPQGHRWMTTAEAEAIFTGRNYGPSEGGLDERAQKRRLLGDADPDEPKVYYDQCGWEGYQWKNTPREVFRFRDSKVTGAYKSAGSPDSRRPDLDPLEDGAPRLSTKRFAGIVCIADPGGRDASPTGRELWASDGHPERTVRAAEIFPGGAGSHADPRYLAVFDDALFFSADDGEHGHELHRFVADDAGGANLGRGRATMVVDIRRGPHSSFPKFLTACGDALWFAADDGARGEELYASDGGLG